MHVIAVINHKGGAAKTTTAVNLAAALVERGQKVLVVDLDPQASASLWLGVRKSGQELLKAMLEGNGLAELVQSTAFGLDLIPSGAALGNFERFGATKTGAESLLRGSIENLPERWEYILLDCPPSLSLTSVNALVAASRALVPVTAQVLSLEPLARLLETIWHIRGSLNPQLKLNGIFGSRVDYRTAHGPEVVRLLREQFGDSVYDVSIRENSSLAEAAGFQRPITHYAPSSNGAEDYRALAAEFEERLENDLATERL